ncbi:MAG: hypothetical protein ACHQIL_00070 [Steroidobacterales bacterium]
MSAARAKCLPTNIVQDNGVTGPPISARARPTALAHPEETRLGTQLEAATSEHDGNSGFRIITAGVDGSLSRAQMITSAEPFVISAIGLDAGRSAIVS